MDDGPLKFNAYNNISSFDISKPHVFSPNKITAFSSQLPVCAPQLCKLDNHTHNYMFLHPFAMMEFVLPGAEVEEVSFMFVQTSKKFVAFHVSMNTKG